MKITPGEKKLQTEFMVAIATNFKQWCKDNKISLSSQLKEKGKVSRQAIYDIINGKRDYLPPVAISYLASKTNLSIGQLATYKTVTNICAN